MLCDNHAITIPYRRASTLLKCTNSVVISIVVHQAHIFIRLLLLCNSLLLFLLINLRLKWGSILSSAQLFGEHVRALFDFLASYINDIGHWSWLRLLRGGNIPGQPTHYFTWTINNFVLEIILNSHGFALLVWQLLLITIKAVWTLLFTVLRMNWLSTFTVCEALFKGKSVRIVVVYSLGSIHYVN